MKKEVDILIVDDHPVIIWGYKSVISTMKTDTVLRVESSLSCDDVLYKINQRRDNFFNIVLLDIHMPASKDNSFTSGEDLGLLIRKKFPKTKIIVHTSLSDSERILNIFKSLNPEGFLLKSQITPKELHDTINLVLIGQSFYSKDVSKLIDNSDHSFFLDSFDRKILYHLAKGERMKYLPNHIPISMATIERRKKRLKLLLLDELGGNDRELLQMARKKGYI